MRFSKRILNHRWLLLLPLALGLGVTLLYNSPATQAAASPATVANVAPGSGTHPQSGRAFTPGSDASGAVTSGGAHIQDLSSVRDLFYASPIINSLIAAMSVLALMLFIYFLLTVNRSAMAPRDLVEELTKLVRRGKYEQASELCGANRRVFIATIVQRCVENAGKGHGVIMGMIDTEGRRRADIIWNRISYLADVANIAPMLGLLGTVVGMIHAFFGLGHDETATINANILSHGVAQAMGTTLFGLIVAIFATVLYAIVKSRVTRTLADAEAAVHTIADQLQREVAV